MRRSIEEVVKALNNVGSFLEKDLEKEIYTIVNERLEVEISSVRKDINALENDVEVYKKILDDLAEELKDELDEFKGHMSKEISSLDAKLSERLSLFEKSIQVQIDAIFQKINGIISEFNNKVLILDNKIIIEHEEMIRTVNYTWNKLVKYVNKHFDKLSNTLIKVENPVFSYEKEMTLQQALNFLAVWMYGITNKEFNALRLTNEEFNKLGLTNFEFKFFRKHRDYWKILSRKEFKKGCDLPIDLFGRKRKNQVSCIPAFLGGMTSSEFNNYGLTVEQFNRVSSNIKLKGLNRWGKYYLANHGTSLLKDVVHLSCDEIVISNAGKSEITGILSLDTDFKNGEIPTAEMLTQDSIEKMVWQPNVEVVDHQHGCYTLSINQFTLVSGGIAFNGYVMNDCTDSNGVPCSIVIHLNALTTTYERGDIL